MNVPLIVTLNATNLEPVSVPSLVRQILDFKLTGTHIEAIGFSCTEPEKILECLIAIEKCKELSEELNNSHISLVVCPNLNDRKNVDLGKFNTSTFENFENREEMNDEKCSGYIKFCRLFIEHGASYIGACCGSSPRNIDALNKFVTDY